MDVFIEDEKFYTISDIIRPNKDFFVIEVTYGLNGWSKRMCCKKFKSIETNFDKLLKEFKEKFKVSLDKGDGLTTYGGEDNPTSCSLLLGAFGDHHFCLNISIEGICSKLQITKLEKIINQNF